MRGSVGAGGGGSRRLPGAPRRDDPQPVDAAVPSAHLTHRTGPNIFRLPAVTWRTNMPWPQRRNGCHLNAYAGPSKTTRRSEPRLGLRCIH
jgi:hypothetical protein